MSTENQKSPVSFKTYDGESAPTALAEIEIYPTQGGNKKDFLMGLSVRFGTYTFQEDFFRRNVDVLVTEANISITTEGCRIAPSSYAGARSNPTVTTVAISGSRQLSESTREKKTESVSGKLSVGPTQLSGDGAVTQSYEKEGRSKTEVEEYKFEEVKASFHRIPNQNWSVTDVQKPFLYGNYQPEDHFCKIELLEQSGEVRSSVSILPKHIEYRFADEGRWYQLKLHPSRDALTKALLAKELKNLNCNNYESGSALSVIIGVCRLGFEVTDE